MDALSFILQAAILLVVMTTASGIECLTMETFNVGLLPSVDKAKERKPLVLEAINKSTSDFICVQELWMEKDLNAILKGVESQYPYHFSAIHHSIGNLRPRRKKSRNSRLISKKGKPCSRRDSFRLSTRVTFCAIVNGCRRKSGADLAKCISQNCQRALKSISEICVSCFVMNAFNSFQDAINSCMLARVKKHKRMNGPGLLVLSKIPLTSASYKKFFPNNRMSIQRGYIQVELPDRLRAVCTHLSSSVSTYVEYDLHFGSYERQQLEEIELIGDVYNLDHVLLGDLNTGPEITDQDSEEKNLVGEFPDNYDRLLQLGYTSPYVTSDGRCTYCSNNPLTNNDSNKILDHIMTKGGSFIPSDAKRLHDSSESSVPISDHYGVSLRVCRIK